MQSLCTRYESTAAMHLPHQNLRQKIAPVEGQAGHLVHSRHCALICTDVCRYLDCVEHCSDMSPTLMQEDGTAVAAGSIWCGHSKVDHRGDH